MKKRFFVLVVAILFAILCSAAILSGCNKKVTESTYFNNFSSQGQFSGATECLTLDEGVAVYSFDAENEVFVVYTQALNDYAPDGYINLFGLASPVDGMYTPLVYGSVLGIRGDIAIVTKPAVVDGIYRQGIGVIKFRGANKGDLTDFMPVYNTSFSQFYFAGDYIACPGDKMYPFSTAPYTTFYDYSTDHLLEVFKVRCDMTYDIEIYDDYLVAASDDYAFFYDINDIQSDGFLTYDERGTYIGYPEDVNAEYTEAIDINIYYLGNGWFSRTARLMSDKPFIGYNIMYEQADLVQGTTETVYANIRCDFYNAKSRTVTDGQGLIVDNVANKYYVDYYAQMAAYLNNLAPFDENTGEYDYYLPYMDVSAMIKDGYSIVYYYFLPYVDSGSLRSEITFCLMDTRGTSIEIADMLMPAVYVDGVGTETSDPFYDEYFGSVRYLDLTHSAHELIAMQGGKNTYKTGVYNGKGIVAGQMDYTKLTVKYGAVNPDGKLVIPFEYAELTPFYGDYALGSQNIGFKVWYRLSADGEKEQALDVVNVRQGVYVFDKNGKLGLKNYAGDILLEGVYDKLDVYQVFLTGGKFQTDYVIAVKDGVCKIYTLF